MYNLISIGRFLLAFAILAFGIQHLMYAWSGTGLGPPWTPENRKFAYLAGAFLVVSGVSLASGKKVRMTAVILGVLMIVRAVFFYAPQLAKAPHDPGPWTSSFELLAFAGASLMLASISATGNVFRGRTDRVLQLFGRVLFVASLIVFGAQHFIYAGFIAGLIPTWIHGRLFWAYFVGGAFIATALATATGRQATLAAALLGTMFLVWVLILHGPRVAGAVTNSNEWTSLVVAIGMGGCAFLVAAVPMYNSRFRL